MKIDTTLELEEEMGTAAIPSTNTSSVPDPKNIGYKKRDRRHKYDVDHMYRRNLIDKAISIIKKRKAKKLTEKDK